MTNTKRELATGCMCGQCFKPDLARCMPFSTPRAIAPTPIIEVEQVRIVCDNRMTSDPNPREDLYEQIGELIGKHGIAPVLEEVRGYLDSMHRNPAYHDHPALMGRISQLTGNVIDARNVAYTVDSTSRRIDEQG